MKPLQIEDAFSKEVIYEIGLLFVTASASENALSIHLARLIAHPRQLDAPVVATLAGADVKVRLMQIQLMARYRLTGDTVKEVVKLCDKIRDSFDRRNEFAHFVSAPGNTPDRVALRTPKPKADGSMVPAKHFTARQIREFTSTLYDRIRELDSLLVKAGIARI